MRRAPGSPLRRLTSCCVIAGLLAIGALATVQAKVSAQFDAETDFDSYRTYAWKTGNSALRPALEKAIVGAVDREMAVRGLTKTEESPDLYVLSYALAESHTLEQLADETYWRFWTGVRTFDLGGVKKGSLVVDLLDAASETRVWRGLATAAISPKVKKIETKINREVRKMFEELPRGVVAEPPQGS